LSLPSWPDGTVAILATGGGDPHAIPVSTTLRAGPSTIVFALAHGRESLARLRSDPRCALAILAADVALTAYGTASVVAERERVVIVQLDVESVQDHRTPAFVIEEGVRWRWLDAGAEGADAEVRAWLRESA
jgi:hypothetical protein